MDAPAPLLFPLFEPGSAQGFFLLKGFLAAAARLGSGSGFL